MLNRSYRIRGTEFVYKQILFKLFWLLNSSPTGFASSFDDSHDYSCSILCRIKQTTESHRSEILTDMDRLAGERVNGCDFVPKQKQQTTTDTWTFSTFQGEK